MDRPVTARIDDQRVDSATQAAQCLLEQRLHLLFEYSAITHQILLRIGLRLRPVVLIPDIDAGRGQLGKLILDPVAEQACLVHVEIEGATPDLEARHQLLDALGRLAQHLRGLFRILHAADHFDRQVMHLADRVMN
ncbi:hypothetical protein SDC9_204551 [bioreactor metagenome]|uniref:Uncharacterized protein n=1 Tax=bioreactor metagenome TaxID=1076179 RepID=A0A645IZK7_9ZZZZ